MSEAGPKRRYGTVSPYAKISPTKRNNQKRGLRLWDGNSPEAHFIRRATKMLIEHVGGPDVVTVPQRALIDKICWIELRCAILNRKAFFENHETPYDQDIFLAHAGKLKLLYEQLGIEKPKASLAQLMAVPRHGRVPKTEAAD
jgi:hypothetical protein